MAGSNPAPRTRAYLKAFRHTVCAHRIGEGAQLAQDKAR